MKSQVKFFLVALAMIGLCFGFTAAAQADSMYVGWVYTGTTKNSVVQAYSTAGVNQGITYNYNFTGYYIQGIAVAPTVAPANGNLYVTAQKAAGGDYRIVTFNSETGALVNGNFYSTTNNAVRPMCFDSSGNLYAGLATYDTTVAGDVRGRILKITPEGVVDDHWGNPADSVYTGGVYASDLEVRGNYLYAAVAHDATNKTRGAVVRYDLSGSTNVNPELMTADLAGAPAYSLAFGPDGTLYTVGNNSHNVVGKWTWNSTTQLYDSFTSITPTGCLYPQDVDYFDGAIYITDKQAPRMVRKYDLTTQTWSDVVQYPAATPYTGWTHGWVAFTPTVVPEPSTLALLAGGLVGLLAYAWRKRK